MNGSLRKSQKHPKIVKKGVSLRTDKDIELCDSFGVCVWPKLCLDWSGVRRIKKPLCQNPNICRCHAPIEQILTALKRICKKKDPGRTQRGSTLEWDFAVALLIDFFQPLLHETLIRDEIQLIGGTEWKNSIFFVGKKLNYKFCIFTSSFSFLIPVMVKFH